MIFNATNVHLLINGFWLNDACSISWQQQGGVEPLWGYMDDRFRDVARVTNMIVGTVGIYFREHDKFFRYLAGQRSLAEVQRDAEQKRIKDEVANAVQKGNLVILLAGIPPGDPAWEKYASEAMQQFSITTREESPGENGVYTDADPVGKSGFEAGYAKRGAGGTTLDVYSGDGSESVRERLYNVWVTGRARSPIENSPQTGAQPTMEYFSFIASHLGRAPADARTE